MPENRKYYPHNAVVFVTSRTEEGLPLVASLFLNFIVWGILARARSMFEVRICHFLFMFNHFHMLLVVDNPEHVPEFIGYVKGEIAHAVNSLLGRRQKTIWQDGYDSPIMLTAADVLKYINYIYLNPARANLEERIDDYPGVSSWQMFINGRHKAKLRRLVRPAITPLPFPALSINEQRRLVGSYEKLPGIEAEFILEPDAWMECFPEVRGRSCESMKKQIIETVRMKERELSEKRKREEKTVIGATALRRQSMLKEYRPTKFSRRMICLCSVKELRLSFIGYFKALADIARKAYESWKQGDLSKRMPAGLFAPRVPNLMSALPLRT